TAIAELSGIWNVHVAMEESVMYPRMLKHASVSLKETARRHFDELADLRQDFSSYLRKWRTGKAIKDHIDDFVADSKAIMERIAGRIVLENKELYRLAESVSMLQAS